MSDEEQMARDYNKSFFKPPKQEILEEALDIATGPRQALYGSPSQNFIDTADIITVLLRPKLNGSVIEPHEVAMILAALKMARLINSPGHKDNWTDLIGYGACGYEAWVESGKSLTPMATASAGEIRFCHACDMDHHVTPDWLCPSCGSPLE